MNLPQIIVTGSDWYCALVPEMEISGFGKTREEALDALELCLRSNITLRIKLAKDSVGSMQEGEEMRFPLCPPRPE